MPSRTVQSSYSRSRCKGVFIVPSRERYLSPTRFSQRGTVKVDTARRQGGIKIVWLAWFTDSIALWQRQDETPYLIDPEPVAARGPASPPSDPNQISSDPEPDADDWDEDRRSRAGGEGEEGEDGVELDVDWAAMDDEVDAAMNESDDESGVSVRSGARSGNASEEEWTDESNSIIRCVVALFAELVKRLTCVVVQQRRIIASKTKTPT